MELPKKPCITLDGPFDPWRVQAVRHSLSSHPLLQMDSLIELGKRLEARGRIRSHSDQAKADTPFNSAPETHPSGKRGTEALADVAKAGAWTSLLNVQTDDIYRTLVDEVLGSVKPMVDAVDPGMSYRGGWIFVTSPHAVTPFHMDMEHNFIVQILGKKRLYVWDPFDRSVVAERGRELFLSYQSRELVRFHEDFRKKATVFELEPGMGGYMPSTSPHMVENGDGPSVTMSFTYYTDSTRKRNLLYRGKTHLRRLGFDPLPVGTDPIRDSTLTAAMQVYAGAKELALRTLGKEVHPLNAPYAFHTTS
jgi:Cupin-like domain